MGVTLRPLHERKAAGFWERRPFLEQLPLVTEAVHSLCQVSAFARFLTWR